MRKNITKKEWVDMYETLGWDGPKRMQWHKLFESLHPDGHQGFLEWLGIAPNEVAAIRAESR